VRTVPGVRPATRSAADLALLITSAEVGGVTGAYFFGRKSIASSKESYDRGRAERLSAASEELAKAA
jgi:broad specificity polyphosphatase/5'/3'-nucleotidase SurE